MAQYYTFIKRELKHFSLMEMNVHIHFIKACTAWSNKIFNMLLSNRLLLPTKPTTEFY